MQPGAIEGVHGLEVTRAASTAAVTPSTIASTSPTPASHSIDPGFRLTPSSQFPTGAPKLKRDGKENGECSVPAPEQERDFGHETKYRRPLQTPAWGVDAVWRRGLPRRQRRKGKVRAVMTRWRIATVSLCAACLMLPARAGAARIEIRPGAVAGTNQLVYTAGPGEVNSPGLQHQQDTYYLQDSRGPLTERVPPSGPPPNPGGLGVISQCPDPADAVTTALVDLGDLDDFGDVDQNTLLFIPVTVLGGAGADRISMHSAEGNVLDGGPGDDVIESEGPSPDYRFGGTDTVAGGEGNDKIHTSDDHRDTVSCGPGTDRVTADVTDDVAADCETVERQFEPPWVRADGRPIGVSIDDGATYTNSLDV